MLLLSAKKKPYDKRIVFCQWGRVYANKQQSKRSAYQQYSQVIISKQKQEIGRIRENHIGKKDVNI